MSTQSDEKVARCSECGGWKYETRPCVTCRIMGARAS